MHTIQAPNNETVIIPTVRNIEEAEILAPYFPAVLTVGPTRSDVANFGHDNHLVLSFGDTHDEQSRYRPRMHHVEDVVAFGDDNDGPILVHCHMGISRSTSSALAILLARDIDPETAVRQLAAIHPQGRTFAPNDLIVRMTADLLDIPDLPKIVNSVSNEHWRQSDGWSGFHPLKYAPTPKAS